VSASHSADFGDNKNRCIVNIGPSKNHIFASFIIYKISKNQFFFLIQSFWLKTMHLQGLCLKRLWCTWQHRALSIKSDSDWWDIKSIRAKSLDLNGKDGGWNIFKISWNFYWIKVLEAARGCGTSLKRNGHLMVYSSPIVARTPCFQLVLRKLNFFLVLCNKKVNFLVNSCLEKIFRINYILEKAIKKFFGRNMCVSTSKRSLFHRNQDF